MWKAQVTPVFLLERFNLLSTDPNFTKKKRQELFCQYQSSPNRRNLSLHSQVFRGSEGGSTSKSSHDSPMFKSPSNTGFLPVSQHSSANHLRQAGDAVPRIHSILCLLVTKNLKSNDLMMQTNQIVMRDSTLATISQLTQVHGRPSLQPGIHCVQLELCLQQSKSLVRIAGYRSR